MKKFAIIAASALLCLSGCTKSYSPYSDKAVGMGETSNNTPSRSYMMAIVDDMVTGALEELETAFRVDQLGNGSSVRFDISGGSILTEGVSWKVTGKERALCGMTIKNIGADTWEMDFNGPFSLLGDVYPVNFIMKAKRGSLISGNHYNWGITLNGNRTEREGYSCTYATKETVLYMSTQNNTVGWNYLEGAYTLTVLLNQEPIDQWSMVLNGNLGNTEFYRGI